MINPLAYLTKFRPVLYEAIRSFILLEFDSDGIPFRLVDRPNKQQSLFPLRELSKALPELLDALASPQWVLEDATHWLN